MNMNLRSAIDARTILYLIVFQTGEHHFGIKAKARRILRRLQQ
ncbi:hypothetical protein BH24CHL1_BH24CHL1_13310 [soil metagenome]|jgi:hypothetical protein